MKNARTCGDASIESGREPVIGAYAFFARYVLRPWQSCLDVGGGLGEGKKTLLNRSNRIKAIDVDPQLESRGVEVGNIANEQSDSFDWVLAIDVVEHLENDKDFVQDLLRVSRRGVFVTTPNLEHHPDRNWPYHVREYSPCDLARLFEKSAPGNQFLQFGSDTYGGHMSMRNLSPKWEHQAILCFKSKNLFDAPLLHCREFVISILRKQPGTTND